MKEFRKTEDRLFICEECDRTFKNLSGLGKHINTFHNTKNYYDTWLKEDNEGFCKICGVKTNFTSIQYSYKNCCSKKCSNIYTQKQTEKGNIEKYGVKNVFQLNNINEKSLNTREYKYGNKNYTNKEKYKQTMMNRYGVAYAVQKQSIHEKQQKTACKTKQFRNTDLYYQASYELDFLNNFYDKFSDIKRGPTIKYTFENKEHFYFPDFYIPSLNLIVEIKNKNLYNFYLNKNKIKEKATIANGFNYLIIIDKNYSEISKYKGPAVIPTTI